jgi:hypothetical protein
VESWTEADLGRGWTPPACADWSEPGLSSLIATAARFRYTGGAEGLLRRVGAVSELAGMRYWSTTHQKWQTLIVSAHALAGPQSSRRREDFTPSEMTQGKALYLEQTDNLSGASTYRMRILVASPERLVFEIENIAPIRYLFLTLFDPGEMQWIYFLDRESEDVWRYYGMVRTGRNASRLATGHESSSINRAVAFYRVLAGIPTDQEPPPAR